MDEPKVILVMLRQPMSHRPNEMRTDPLWEFGSFGCTRCHRRNLMNPKKLTELNGVRFAFAQNGDLGIKLVHVTPPLTMLHHGSFGEAKWAPAEMPLSYASAPTLVNNSGESDIPGLLDTISDVRRRTPVAQFASKFRSRRLPLEASLGKSILKTYRRFRRNPAGVSQSYVDAMPFKPPLVDGDREATYQQLLGNFLPPRAKKGARPRGRARC